MFATAPKLVVALVSWWLLTRYGVLDAAGQGYAPGWLAHVVLRDLVITLVGGGLWEAVLYAPFSPWRAAAARAKFNPVYPPLEHVRASCLVRALYPVLSIPCPLGHVHALCPVLSVHCP